MFTCRNKTDTWWMVLNSGVLVCSVRQGVPRAKKRRKRRRAAVRDESAAKGEHRAEDEDYGAHEDGAPSARVHPPVAIPCLTPLRLPDRRQTPPHPR